MYLYLIVPQFRTVDDKSDSCQFAYKHFCWDGTNLNTLTLPHTFSQLESMTRDAQSNYVIGLRPFVDTSGHVIYGTNTYAATTADKNFTLTILSREDNRLQGVFDGELKNQDGQVINCKNGLFDIRIVEQ